MTGNFEDLYKLSPLQKGILFHSLYNPESGIYFEQFSWTIPEDIDTGAFQRAWQQVLDSNPILRTAFYWEDFDEPLQAVHWRAELPLQLYDWRELPPDEQAAQLETYLEDDRYRGFELSEVPLLRLTLIRMAEDAYYVVFSYHHLLLDGWSVQLVLKDVATLYAAFRQGGTASLPPHRPYRDYIAWLRRQDLDRAEAFWRHRLQGIAAPTRLGIDQPASGANSAATEYEEQQDSCSLELTTAAQTFVRQRGLTMSTLLQASWALLLSRYSGEQEVLFGVTVAGRPPGLAGSDAMIGLFINTLPMRVQVPADAALQPWLEQLHVQLGELLEYEYTPLVEIQGWSDVPREQPLFESIVVFENYPVTNAVRSGDLRIWQRTNYPLTIVAELYSELRIRVAYDTSRFDAATITLLLRHLQVVLEGMVATPDQDLANISLTTEAERRQLLAAWQAPLPLYPAETCIHQLFEAQAARASDAVAVVFERPTTNDQRPTTNDQRRALHPFTPSPLHPFSQQLTYDELNRRANQLAHHLQALDVGPEMLVGLCAERSPALVVGILGVLKAGAAYLPLDPAYPAERLAFMLEDAQVTVLLTQKPIYDLRFTIYDLEGKSPVIQNPKSKIVNLDVDWPTIAAAPSSNPACRATPGNLAYVIYTSGSTGLPKGSLIAHRQVVRLFAATQDWFHVAAHDIWTLFHSYAFDFSVWELWGALCYGGRLVVVSYLVSRSPAAFYDLLCRERVTVLNQTPSAFRQLMTVEEQAPRRAAELALRLVIFGGEALDVSSLKPWMDRHDDDGPQLVNMYGITETTVHVSYRPITPADLASGRASPIGRAIPDLRLYLLDQQLKPAPTGVPAELYVAGAGLGRGYLNRPDLTAERFIPNPFAEGMGDGGWGMGSESSIPHPPSPIPRLYRTGDLARYRANGEIEYLRRLDDQVKIRGFRIEPGEIAAVLNGHPAVREAVVLAREDTPGDQRLVAYVVPKIEDRGLKIEDSGSDAPDPLSSILYPLSSELHAFLQERLPDYMVPAVFVPLEALPLTAHGKLDRSALPIPDHERPALDSTLVAPRTPIEEVLVGIWADVLGIRQVGVHDSFFALGGHSLLATQLISRLHDAFQVDLSIRSLFEAPSVAAMAKRIEVAQQAAQTQQAPPILPISRDPSARSGQGMPLSFAQQRLWFLDQLQPGGSTYNIPSAVRLRGRLDLAAFQQSIGEIVRRHEALRTTFAAIDGRPVQVIGPAMPVPLPVLDLLQVSDAERTAELRRLVKEEAERPFDLAHGPLLRITLLKIAEEEHFLLLMTHHIVFDGWSLGVLVRELAALYTAFIAGKPSPLPELPIQYADYAIWQRHWLQGSGVGGQGTTARLPPPAGGGTEGGRSQESDVDERTTQNSKLKTQNSKLLPHPPSPIEAQLDYWRAQLADLPVLELPSDRPRPLVPSFQGAILPFQLTPQLTEALAALNRREESTLFMTLLAAFQTLLYRYTGQADVVVGTPIAGRNRSETEDLIGCFINTQVLRTDLSGNPQFRELLGRVREVCLAAYAHQDLPFEQLVEKLHPERDLNRTPLFHMLFSLQNAPMPPLALPGVTMEPVIIGGETAKFDLSLALQDTDYGLLGELEYSTDLFDKATIARVADHFQVVLQGIVASPDQPIGELPLLTETEREQLLVEWNNATVSYPTGQSIHTLFAAQVARTPDAVALVFAGAMTPLPPPAGGGTEGGAETRPAPSGNEGRQGDKETRPSAETQPPTPNTQHPTPNPRHLTYHDLNRQANHVAYHLRSLGVGPDARVGICLERSLAMVVGLLGILKAGGAYVPLDPAYPQERQSFILEDAQVSVLLTQQAIYDLRFTIYDLEGKSPVIQNPKSKIQNPVVVLIDADGERLAAQPGENPDSLTAPENLAYVIYTSGSTGRPKGVLIAHQALVDHSYAVVKRCDMQRTDRLLQFASLNSDIAVEDFFPTWLSGATVVLWPDPGMAAFDTFSTFVDQERLSVLNLPTAYWHEWVSYLMATGTCVAPTLRLVMVGGEKALPERLATWRELIGDRVRWSNVYGPTEATVSTTIYEPQLGLADLAQLRSIPIGRPIANTQTYLLDQHMNPVPIGIPGEIHIGGARLARGYLGHPALTAERFVPNPFGEGMGDGGWGMEASSPSPIPHPPSPGTRLYKTGDLGRYLPNGNIEFLGRIDHQVKVRGFRIEPGETEAVCRQHPAVRDVVVVAREDTPGDRRLVAYVVLRTEGRGLSGADSSVLSPQSSVLGELRGFLKERLPGYMVPAVFMMLDSLPLSPNGKVDLKALPAPDATRPALDDALVAPRTPVEAALGGIWAAVLRLEQVGIYDNFFALGGDSILSIQIIARANQAGLRLTPRDLFLHQTIASLAAVAGATQPTSTEQEPVTGPVPLTPVQRWFFAQDLPDPQHFNQDVLLELRQPLDPALLEQAMQRLLMHHDALRLRFRRTEAGWQQFNTGVTAQPIVTRVDLSTAPAAERDAALAAAVARQQASLDLEEGPLVRATLIDLGADQPGRLSLVIHHLVVDGVSWRILLEDLQNVYEQISRGETVTLPLKTTSFKGWAERLVAYAQSATAQQELAYWLAALPRDAVRLPLDEPDGANTVASAQTLSLSLDAAATRALLREVPQVYRTQINDLLLTALAQTLAAWAGTGALLVELEGHGREDLFDDVDLSRSVGWFTTLFPVCFDLTQADGPGMALKAIKEQLRQVPRRGIGYGLLRYLCADSNAAEQLRALPQPEVTFNYLGQVDQVLPAGGLFGPAREAGGPAQSPRGTRSHLLDVAGIVAGGQLHMTWTYSAAIHRRETIARLAHDFLAALQGLIDHCLSPEAGGYTPSDFPLARLDQAALDRLVGRDQQVEDVYPLTPLQQGMLFHTLQDSTSGMYVEQLSFPIYGALDVAAFTGAWQQVVDRHSVLRTAFFWEDLKAPVQVVYQHVPLQWTIDDWRELAPDEQETRLAAFLADDRQRGFTLSQPPLMRVSLFRVAEDVHEFIWSSHHMLMDGWSVPLVLREVFARYASLVHGHAAQFASPRPYREYIAWLQQQDLRQAEMFWRRTLAGFRAPTPLGVDRTGETDGQATGSAALHLQLPESVTAALHTLARQRGLTLSTLVQGAWALLLSRYSGATDVVFGATVAGRPPDLPGVETMVGLFINTLPVRVQVEPGSALPGWLKQFQAQQVELRQYEYSSLVDIQGWSEVPRGQPLFESILVFENYPVDTVVPTDDQLVDLTIGKLRIAERTNYPLTVIVSADDGLKLRLIYDCGRFAASGVERLLGHLQVLLEGIAAGPEQDLADLPLLTGAERRQLVTWNATTVAYPDDRCVHHLVEAQVAQTPEAVAVVFWGQGSGVRGQGATAQTPSRTLPQTPSPLPPPAGGGTEGGRERTSSVLSPQSLTYDELNRRANHLAHYLRRHAVGPDVCVGIALERSLEAVVAVLGVLKAGGAYVPLDPAYPPERLAFMLQDSQAAVLITTNPETRRQGDKETRRQGDKALQEPRTAGFQEPRDCENQEPGPDDELKTQNSKLKTQNYTPSPPHLVTLSGPWPAIARGAPDDPVGALDPSNLAYVIYTSGSTGQPKGVAMTHRPLVNLIAWQRRSSALPGRVRTFQFAPLSFDVSFQEIFSTWCAGGTLIVVTEAIRRDPALLRRVLIDEVVERLFLPFVALQQLAISFDEAGPARSALREVITAGEQLQITPPIAHVLSKLPGCVLHNQYGPSETHVVTAYTLAGATAGWPLLPPIGRPIANTQIYVLDEHLRPVPIGIAGELYIGGVSLARGYLHRPELTAERFVPNPFAQGMGDGGWGMGNESSIPHPPSPIPRLYKTGDRARYQADGNIEFLGRIDQQVKVRGFRIEPGEVEAVLGQHPAVREAVVVAREDRPGDRRLVAYVVPTNDQRPTTNDQRASTLDASSVLSPQSSVLRMFLAERLPDYMVPSVFVLSDTLPLTPSGKVDRRALLAPDRERPALDAAYVAPRTPLEEQLAAIWIDVLGVERAGVDDNFFALGGHSLLATQVLSRVRAELHVEVPLRTLFVAPTLAGLAEAIIQQAIAQADSERLARVVTDIEELSIGRE